MRQIEERLEPIIVSLAVLLDFDPSLRTAQHGTDGDGENRLVGMPHGIAAARVGQVLADSDQQQGGVLFHTAFPGLDADERRGHGRRTTPPVNLSGIGSQMR